MREKERDREGRGPDGASNRRDFTPPGTEETRSVVCCILYEMSSEMDDISVVRCNTRCNNGWRAISLSFSGLVKS